MGRGMETHQFVAARPVDARDDGISYFQAGYLDRRSVRRVLASVKARNMANVVCEMAFWVFAFAGVRDRDPASPV